MAPAEPFPGRAFALLTRFPENESLSMFAPCSEPSFKNFNPRSRMLRAVQLFVCSLALLATFTVQADDSPTQEFQAQDLTLQVPKTWSEKPVTNNLRLAQFEIAPVEGDSEGAELVVFPPFGGTVAENVRRWVGQFQSDGLTADITQGKSPQGTYVIADLSGTYNKPDGPPFMRKTKPAPGYRMVAVMLTTEKGGSYFLKLTGPAKTVESAVGAFRKSFGADKSKEEKYEY